MAATSCSAATRVSCRCRRYRSLDHIPQPCARADFVDLWPTAAVFRVRQELSAHDEPADGAGALFRHNYAPYHPAARLLRPGVDAARRSAGFLRQRCPTACCPTDADIALAGSVLRGDREADRRHAGEGGSHVDGEFARSAVPAARSRAGRTRRDHSARLEDRRRPGEANSSGRARRPPARGAAQSPEDGASACPLPTGFAARCASFSGTTLTAAQFLDRGIVSPEFLRGAARRTRQRPPRQQPLAVVAAHPVAVVPGDRTARRAGCGLGRPLPLRSRLGWASNAHSDRPARRWSVPRMPSATSAHEAVARHHETQGQVGALRDSDARRHVDLNLAPACRLAHHQRPARDVGPVVSAGDAHARP